MAFEMELGKSGWFAALVREEVERFVPRPSPEEQTALPGRARARRFLRHGIRESGLLYGTPVAPTTAAPTTAAPTTAAPTTAAPTTAAPTIAATTIAAPMTAAPEARLYLAVLRAFTRLGLEVAWRAGAPEVDRAAQLLVPFALLCDQLELARDVARQLSEGKLPSRRQWAKVEQALADRALSLSGDPVYGLVLHNGAVYVDAQLFGRLALSWFSAGRVRPRVARRMIDLSAQELAILVEVLVALACAERPPGATARRAILRQVESLALPRELRAPLVSRLKRGFDHTPDVAAVVARVHSPELKRFLLEQTLLASLVDGRRSSSELAFLARLSTALGIPPDQRARYELEVADFYARHRPEVDVFTVTEGASRMGEEWVDAMSETVEKNFHRLLREVKQTGELSVLLAKAARGISLTAEEKRRMREQLIDVAKAIPALAIFAAPGGMLLLLALAKVLPFSLLPSAFQDDPGPEHR